MSWDRWRGRTTKLLHHPRPLRFMASRLLWRAGVSHLLTTRLDGGLRVRFYPSSISAGLWVDPDARSEDTEFLRLVLRPGDTYVDCGANIGHLALVARSLVGPNGGVVAIEPNPRIFEYCVGNLRLNEFGDVRALNVAVGEAAGRIGITDVRADDQNHVGDGAAEIAVTPLDDLPLPATVTLLKIDVEGYELPALLGAARTLERTTVVYCELSSSNTQRFGYSPAAVEDFLLDAGFLFARRDLGSWALTRARLYVTRSTDPATGYNLVAIRQSSIEQVAERLAGRGIRLAIDP